LNRLLSSFSNFRPKLTHKIDSRYIHLPGFMLANSGKPHTLRVGLTLLHRMHRVKLHPADEICYRVMMQLCGVYNQPVVAVKVLNINYEVSSTS
jgi:hypothetical protein